MRPGGRRGRHLARDGGSRRLEMQGSTRIAPTTPTCGCRFPIGRRRFRPRTRRACTSGRSRSRRHGRARVVLHVGAAESVLMVRVNGDEVGIGKDSHLAASSTSLTPSGSGRTPFAWSWSSGPTPRSSRTRTSGGTAGSRGRCPVLDGPDIPRRRADRRGAGADCGPGRWRSRSRWVGARAAARPAGGWRRRSTGWTAAAAASPRPPPPGGPGDWAVPGPPRRGCSTSSA